MARPRVLVTGFGPFPGVAENPSAWLAETLASQPPKIDAELHAKVLPTAWQAAELMPRLYEKLQPHVMIHFGVSPRRDAQRCRWGPSVTAGHQARRARSLRDWTACRRSCRPSQHMRPRRLGVPLRRILSLQLSLLSLARLGRKAERPPSCPVRPCPASRRPGRRAQQDRPPSRRARDSVLRGLLCRYTRPGNDTDR